jgi:hypothetical protein
MYGVDMRGLVTSQIAYRFPIGSITKRVAGAYNLADPTAGTSPTSTVYACRVQTIKYATSFVDGDLVRGASATVIVFLGTLPAGVLPAVGDAIAFAAPGAPAASLNGAISKIVAANDSGASMTVEVLA